MLAGEELLLGLFALKKDTKFQYSKILEKFSTYFLNVKGYELLLEYYYYELLLISLVFLTVNMCLSAEFICCTLTTDILRFF